MRFDAVHYGHFKCNLRRLVDYDNLWAYTRELYPRINPNGVVPMGPALDFAAPRGRERLGSEQYDAPG